MVDGSTLDRFGAAGLAAALRGGVDCVQVRDRTLPARALLETADRVCRTAAAAEHPVRVLVNRRLDVALAAGADGVHLGFDAISAEEARSQLSDSAWIGVSAHSASEVAKAPGASHAQLAPIFAPLSKRSDRPPLGLACLEAACRHDVPVWAQGGIEISNAAAVLRAGARGVAVTGALSSAEDPERAARALRDALDCHAA